MNNQEQSGEVGKRHRADQSAEVETHSTVSAAPSVIGSWQCQHCHLTSMHTWRGSPHPDDAPGCCGGELMLPYVIPTQEARDIKQVSRWINDIEREDDRGDQFASHCPNCKEGLLTFISGDFGTGVFAPDGYEESRHEEGWQCDRCGIVVEHESI